MEPSLIVISLTLVTVAIVLYFVTRNQEKRILLCFDEMDVDAHLQIMEIMNQIPVLGAKYRRDDINRTIYMELIVERKKSALLYENLKKIQNLEVVYL